MKLVVLIGSAARAGTLAASYGSSERALAAFGFGTTPPHYLGYVEGETTLVSPPVAGRLVARPIQRGDRVAKGDRLYVIDTTQAEAEVSRATAALSEFQARHDNLLTGKRSDELDVIRAQRREAQAGLAMAKRELERQTDLLSRNVASRRSHDQAAAQVSELRARISSLDARERAANLGARESEVAAAAAMIEQSQASLARARNRLSELMPVAPEDALVENTFFNVGEWVPAGSPVISLLPDHDVKLRIFIHEEDVARASPNRRVHFSCDGCPTGLTGFITYVSPRAEYTPPVIYSQGARAKLVFMVEARPDPTQARLPPGLPVSVESIANNRP
ncbi:MAG TPA: HlyD family efflux transporter periplasmic adaptor subunit [Reyranella sp.]|nr:HlyD family efflux transporter periplasmic adaptor subunit [Reyranella sp.]